MGDGKVNYIDFGGVLVPENSRRTTIAGQNGQILYCIFFDDKDAKAIYPKQTAETPRKTQYLKHKYSYNVLRHNGEVHTDNISKKEFDKLWNEARDSNSILRYDTKTYYTELNGRSYRNIEQNEIGGSYYIECPVDTKPKIEYENKEGILFDTKKIKVLNLKDANIKGSTDEDEIIVENSTNCTVDVMDHNNNILFSDKVTIINGKNNKVLSGSFDKTAFTTFDYIQNTSDTKAKHSGEGIFRQP